MTLTALVVTTAVIALGIYDLWAVTCGGVDASISAFITNKVGNYPFLMFVCGMLVDDFFWFTMIRKTDAK